MDIISEEELQSVMKNSVAMYLNKSNVLLYGKKGYISEKRTITPKKVNSSVIVPIEFFCESIGAKIEYDSDGQRCKIRKNNKQIDISNTYTFENCIYAPISILCTEFEKYLYIEENGIIIYSDYDMSHILCWKTNLPMMRKIVESYMFDDVTGKTIVDLIKKKHPNHGHPRLIMTEDMFEKIRKEISKADGDEVYKKLFDKVKCDADRFLCERASGYELRDGIRLLYVCRENKERILTLALMYNLTLDERYAKRAYLEMYVAACFVDWNPYHFLDVGELAVAVGIGYDWLYHWMNEFERKPIREAIVQNGIAPIIEDFDELPRNRSWNWRGELADNWCFVIAGVGIGAMSIADELEGTELINAERAIEQTLLDIRRALSLFAPNGGYEEGVRYWGLTMEFFTYHMKSLLTATGCDFGYIDVPGMRNTNKYLFSMNGSNSIFNYHDAGRGESYIPPQSMFLADIFNNYGEAQLRIKKILEENEGTVMDMCLYRQEFREVPIDVMELDMYMPIAETVTMRSGWNKTDTYVGLHCDDPYGGPGHDHMDAGQFVLDALGENFFLDLGPDSYNLPNYHDTYHFRAEGHNTIVINPSREYGQKYGGTAMITKYEFGKEGGYAIGDISDAYSKEDVISSRRGVRLDADRRRTTIQDEVRLKKISEFFWFAHTCANIDISTDGKSAVLDINGKKLLAKIISGAGAKFTVMEAAPLPTSPIVVGQDNNEGIRKLSIHIENCLQLDLCVTFVNYYENIDDAEFTHLDDWRI